MTEALCDAAVALHLYTESDRLPRGIDLDRKITDLMFARMDEQVSGLPPDATEEDRSAIYRTHRDLKQQVARERWQQGEWPGYYLDRLPWIHSKFFLYSMDEIAKALGVLADQPWAPHAIVDAKDKWDSAFPHLKAVRDSAHHAEDRSRGLGRWDRPIEPQPFRNDMIEAPFGLGGPNLINDTLGMLAEDGHYREVAVSADSLVTARDIVQQVINAWSYDGPPSWLP
jgi:hypothetical protein